MSYDDTKKDGVHTTYYPSGNLCTRKTYKNGKLIVDSYFNDQRKEEDVPDCLPENTTIKADGSIDVKGDWVG